MTKTTLSVLFTVTILLAVAFVVHTKNKEPFTVSYTVVTSQQSFCLTELLISAIPAVICLNLIQFRLYVGNWKVHIFSTTFFNLAYFKIGNFVYPFYLPSRLLCNYWRFIYTGPSQVLAAM